MLARIVTAPVSRICLALATLTLAASAQAMPDRTWRGVERIVVLCSVDAGSELGHDAIARDLCERIVRIASPASPLPVEAVEFGNPSLTAPRVAALLVHASVSPASAAVPGASGKIISWTMRTTGTNLIDDAPDPFGVAPRVAPFGGEMDRDLRASLGDILPWVRTAAIDDSLLEQPKPIRRGNVE